MSDEDDKVIKFDEDGFFPEHHMAERIQDILNDEAYRGLTAITVMGVLNTLAMEICIEGALARKARDEGKDGEGWKDGK